MLTQQRLRELLDYNPLNGIFVWRVRRGGRASAGSIAGVISRGYTLIGIDGEKFTASRLAWLYMTGRWPAENIDHIDGDPTNDRWSNLREVNQSENNANGKLIRSNNTSGARGVSWSKEKGKYEAYVNFNKRIYHCGYHDTLESAAAARDAKALQLHGDFVKLNNLSRGDMQWLS